ncbi:uncharacterized protein F4812DRAFT_454847 [Daldinia caldariorum]|uniref:uncharacterized protein n=1 Tax=Daldinia caldariorum TaxID=326644 RepID=UPI0020083568|nr:uncharacterized protein F4812DRAFT_454847 [Daldinia caldariorum]KAI1473028.1 hypothetical protein F4812DRAFT_454847 [Daldinia caldariorum]
MEYTMSNQSLTASSFQNFPVEVVQRTLCHFSWESLIKFTALSPSLLSIFEAAVVRYACTVPSLKEALDIIVEFPTDPFNPTIYLDEKWTCDFRKFCLPSEFWTIAVFRDIMDFHERVRERVALYEGWIRENAGKSDFTAELATQRTPEEVRRVPIAVYAMEIARLMYPDKYAASGDDALIVCFNGNWREWVLLAYEASFDPPFIIGGQNMLNAWSLYIPSEVTEGMQH